MIERACAEKKAISVGLLGNAAEILPELLRRVVRPDMRSPTRPLRMTQSTAICPPAGPSRPGTQS